MRPGFHKARRKLYIPWLCPILKRGQEGDPVPQFFPEEKGCLGLGMPPLLYLGTDSHTQPSHASWAVLLPQCFTLTFGVMGTINILSTRKKGVSF